MNIPDLIDGFITWWSTLPCRANQETPFMDERVFQNRGIWKMPLWHFGGWINSQCDSWWIKYFTNNRSPENANLLPSKSKQTLSDRFRICRNFTVKFGTLSQPGKSGLISSENLFKASQRKDSYEKILAALCSAVGVKVVQNLELFPDCMPVQFLCSNTFGI